MPKPDTPPGQTVSADSKNNSRAMWVRSGGVPKEFDDAFDALGGQDVVTNEDMTDMYIDLILAN